MSRDAGASRHRLGAPRARRPCVPPVKTRSAFARLPLDGPAKGSEIRPRAGVVDRAKAPDAPAVGRDNRQPAEDWPGRGVVPDSWRRWGSRRADCSGQPTHSESSTQEISGARGGMGFDPVEGFGQNSLDLVGLWGFAFNTCWMFRSMTRASLGELIWNGRSRGRGHRPLRQLSAWVCEHQARKVGAKR